MPEMEVRDAGDLPALAARVSRHRQPSWLTGEGRRVAAVIDAVTLERLLGLDSQLRAHSDEPFGDADRADLGL